MKNKFNITVCENPKFIWFRNAKVASRSIKWVLDQQFDNQEFYKKNISCYDLHQYFKFGLVRNPYTRIISAYFNKMVRLFKKENSELNKKHYKYLQHIADYEQTTVKENFKKLLNTLRTPQSVLFNNVHFTPQSNLIDPDKLDFLGRFENLNEDTQFIFQKIGVSQPLPKRNVGPPNIKIDFLKSLDREDLEAIQVLYQKDFELFNYPIHVPNYI